MPSEKDDFDFYSSKIEDKEEDSKKEKKVEEEIPIGEKEVQFCWHCGADTRFRQENFCEICKAPLDETIRNELIKRTEPVHSAKCWRCNGTTSGHICGICGSALTRQGLDILDQNRVIVEQKVTPQTTPIFSPKDRQFIPIEVTFDELTELVNKYVKIVNSQFDEGTGALFFIERPEETNAVFAKFRNDSLLKEKNLKLIIRNEKVSPDVKQITVRFFYWKPESVKEQFHIKKIGWNIGLFVATIVTVSIAGWSFANTTYTEYLFQGRTALDVFLFTFSLMAILTIHEFGHFTISRLKKLDASLPYFIPVPPIPGFQSLGTFGALIRQKEPFATRDDLFDIGIAGPLAGFLVAIPVFIIGLKLTYVVPIPEALEPVDITQVPTVFLADFLITFGQWSGLLPYYDPTMQTIAMHPMMFAGYIGFILTGINLMPASQLDGGHTFRAVFGDVPHRIISLVVALLLTLNPFTRYMGILLLVMSFGGHPGSTDDVSKVHWSKYIYLGIGFVVGILCTPLPLYLVMSYFA
ncbi:MAG: site-2 protease family protein [Asgard group archaeon]|nr:site-2 protease family protein [Asgard group archaeon]